MNFGRAHRPGPRKAWRLQWMALCLLGALMGAQPARAETGPRWDNLSPTQQQALAPLRQNWTSIDAARKQKWLEVAERLGQLSGQERARIQQRMAEWARLPAEERLRARQQFLDARSISPDERQARWQAYQTLPPEKRQQLAAQAQQRQAHLHRQPTAAHTAPAPADADVTRPATSRSAAGVAPGLLQVRPGATTTTLAARPHSAPFQQPGLPKIAATPDFVDPATLLPRRGAQAAARIDPPASAARRQDK